MNVDKDIVKKISSLCGKLKSAWTLQVGFETRLNDLLPEIITLPSDQIDACFEKASKGDIGRQHCMVPIACEHLFHPSLHHRIPGWLEDESLLLKDKVLAAIGRFRLHEFAPYLNRFFFYQRPESDYFAAFAMNFSHAALRSAAILKSSANLTALEGGLSYENTAQNRSLVNHLRSFPQFDAKPYLQKWFREATVVDEIGICERYVTGLISYEERFKLTHDARVIWDLAEQYGEHEQHEVIQFLIQHLDFTETCFSSQKMSQTIVCRGRRATEIIAKLNGWLRSDYESRAFIAALWQELRATPSLALQSECPVLYESLPKDKTYSKINELFQTYSLVLHEDMELGYSIRRAEKGDETILALQSPDQWERWRIIRLTLSDKLQLDFGDLPVAHLFHLYSSRGALIAYHDQIVFNSDDLENKFATKALQKLKKKEALRNRTTQNSDEAKDKKR